jgi:hypothetical protein
MNGPATLVFDGEIDVWLFNIKEKI